MSPIDFIDTGYQTTFTQHLLVCMQSLQPVSCTFPAIKKDRSLFWAEATFNPVLSQDQKTILEIIMVIRDYSEQKKNETDMYENARHKELLLKELHNRVKNNFAILSSLVSMINIDQNNTLFLESLKELQSRIRTMSLVHEQLFKSQQIDSVPLHLYLQTLSSIIVSSFNSGQIKLTTDLEPCLLSVDATLPVGLIVNELVLNAFKYAFPGHLEGRIHISLRDIGHDNFQLIVKDNGIGLPVDFLSKTSNSMGSQIINLLVQQIEGVITLSNEDGACFTITFPVTTRNSKNELVN
jgi:two-component sensor histidine kinase